MTKENCGKVTVEATPLYYPMSPVWYICL